MNALLNPLTETLRRTTGRYILLFTITTGATYALTHLINAITSPITASYGMWAGTLLILTTVAAGLTTIATLALDQTEDHPPSLPLALNNLTRTSRTLPFLLSCVILVFLATAIGSTTGFILMVFLLAWVTPLTLYPLTNEDGNPFHLVMDGIRTTFFNPLQTLPIAVATILVNVVGGLTILGLLYTLPFTAIMHGILYRNVYGTPN